MHHKILYLLSFTRLFPKLTHYFHTFHCCLLSFPDLRKSFVYSRLCYSPLVKVLFSSCISLGNVYLFSAIRLCFP
ncbi:hypothetical protein Nmel_007929 [Mimus melanotis]